MDDIRCGFIIRQQTACEIETDLGGLQILGICVRDPRSRTQRKNIIHLGYRSGLFITLNLWVPVSVPILTFSTTKKSFQIDPKCFLTNNKRFQTNIIRSWSEAGRSWSHVKYFLRDEQRHRGLLDLFDHMFGDPRHMLQIKIYLPKSSECLPAGTKKFSEGIFSEPGTF